MSIVVHLPWSEIVGLHVALAFSCEFSTGKKASIGSFPASHGLVMDAAPQLIT